MTSRNVCIVLSCLHSFASYLTSMSTHPPRYRRPSYNRGETAWWTAPDCSDTWSAFVCCLLGAAATTTEGFYIAFLNNPDNDQLIPLVENGLHAALTLPWLLTVLLPRVATLAFESAHSIGFASVRLSMILVPSLVVRYSTPQCLFRACSRFPNAHEIEPDAPDDIFSHLVHLFNSHMAGSNFNLMQMVDWLITALEKWSKHKHDNGWTSLDCFSGGEASELSHDACRWGWMKETYVEAGHTIVHKSSVLVCALLDNIFICRHVVEIPLVSENPLSEALLSMFTRIPARTINSQRTRMSSSAIP